MISESVIFFGNRGNVVMVVNGALPQDAPIQFKVSEGTLDLITGDDTIIYSETGLKADVCRRLRAKNEIGLLEVTDVTQPPRHLTNVAYQCE